MSKLAQTTMILSVVVFIACGGSQTSSGNTGVQAGSDSDTSVSNDQDTSMSDDAVTTSNTDPDTSVSNDDEACEGYSLGDSCIDESNFAQCQEMAAQCPDQVQVMESCPLQFACP